MVCILAYKESVSGVCSQEVTLLGDGVCCKLHASQVLLKVSKEVEILVVLVAALWLGSCSPTSLQS